MDKNVSEFLIIIPSILFLMFTVFVLLAVEYVTGNLFVSKALLSTATWSLVIIAGFIVLGMLLLIYLFKKS